jgi:hypothetical protein
MLSIIKYKYPGLWNSEYPIVINRVIDIVGSHHPENLHLERSYERLLSFRPQLAKIEAQERADRDGLRRPCERFS